MEELLEKLRDDLYFSVEDAKELYSKCDPISAMIVYQLLEELVSSKKKIVELRTAYYDVNQKDDK